MQKRMYARMLYRLTACAAALCLLCLPAPARADGLTLKTASTFAGTDAAVDTYTKLLRQWENETGNSVSDASASASESWKTGVLKDFAAGNEPDVLFYFMCTADSVPMLSRVVPIREINSAYPALGLPENPDCREADGQAYAIPVREYWEGLFCNADLFEQYHLELPTTWDKLEKAVTVFRENDIVPIAVSLSDMPHYIAEFCILSCGSAQEHDARPQKGEAVPQSWIEGMRLLNRLYEMGAFASDVNTTSDSAANRLFYGKQAAMKPDGSWFANGLPAENMDSTVVLPFPGRDGHAGAAFKGVSMGFYLSRKAWNTPDKRDAAVSLLSYLSTGENAEALGGFAYTGRLKESADAMLDAMSAPQKPFQDDMNQAARSLWFSCIPAIAQGRMTPERMWRDVMALEPFR